jgi:hypothetical protein
MRAISLFIKLTLYYGLFILAVMAILRFVPEAMNHLPVGGAASLLAETGSDPFANIEIGATDVGDLQGNIIWVIIAIIGSAFIALPVTWTYIESRKGKFYNGSIVRTVLILPMILTSIVLMVHNSLALAFSLAGIVSAIRFRNTLKDPGDALYVLIAIGIGIAAGIGALKIAFAMSVVVNYASVLLWVTEFGVKDKDERYMRRPYEDGQEDMSITEAILDNFDNTDSDLDNPENKVELPKKKKQSSE